MRRSWFGYAHLTSQLFSYRWGLGRLIRTWNRECSRAASCLAIDTNFGLLKEIAECTLREWESWCETLIKFCRNSMESGETEVNGWRDEGVSPAVKG